MAQHYENRPIDGAVELLQSNGFDALAVALTVLLNCVDAEKIPQAQNVQHWCQR